ncbi:CLUMA_CG011649, isoform A [Clunio marinus]|uniref:CLUMA_CG011649, isoform A n=1 Tax=Clunio marinus TaxID=568069 RepID=A0A1J1IDC6_9DIPT|nr:CLUMA_CG011649, isoform A [Clunio marinus]
MISFVILSLDPFSMRTFSTTFSWKLYRLLAFFSVLFRLSCAIFCDTEKDLQVVMFGLFIAVPLKALPHQYLWKHYEEK